MTPSRSAPDEPVADDWSEVPRALRDGGPLPPVWAPLFEPLRHGRVDDLVVIGQIGQSLDGRIATIGGRLEYINGAAGLAHLHRLRAVVDAVVIGIGTALADDPLLTVRHVAGPHPARVVIDPRGRLPGGARLLADDGARRIVVTRSTTRARLPAGVERLGLPETDGRLHPAAILGALAAAGLRRVLIEGGADTLSGFLATGCLDRLHVVVAPIILGSGRPGCSLPAIGHADEALRPKVRTVALGDEVLFDCDLSVQRRPLGRARTALK
ncbi:riboflavin deaminase [Rhodoplanes serenus]|uniref:Riboflavin deaminase n=1 Tax=Rhodoplanes serenus TaxID=200615 RepID=A0A9X4XGT3_9BRAD|nr:RibD family protein [Rhodoplanes serenus]MTW14730.1 riboflavin deaminase [Rhodoplanes serenus]